MWVLFQCITLWWSDQAAHFKRDLIRSGGASLAALYSAQHPSDMISLPRIPTQHRAITYCHTTVAVMQTQSDNTEHAFMDRRKMVAGIACGRGAGPALEQQGHAICKRGGGRARQARPMPARHGGATWYAH
jgi:hypothetical protein